MVRIPRREREAGRSFATIGGQPRPRWRSRFWYKLAAIGLALALPLSITTYLLVQQNADRVQATRNELRGLDYLQPLQALLVELAAHRSLSRRVLAGDVARSELDASTARLDAMYDNLLSVDAAFRGTLRTTAADLSLSLRPGAQAVSWRSSRDIASAPDRIEPVHAALIADVRSLIGYIGVTSGLSRDPGTATYRGADAYIAQVPEIVNRMRQLGDDADALLNVPTVTVPDKTRLASTIEVLNLHAEELNTDLQVMFRDADANAGRFDLRNNLELPLYAAYTAVTNLSGTVTREFLRAPKVDLNRAALAEMVDEATTSMARLSTALADSQRRMLQARADGYTKDMRAGLAALAAIVLIAGALTIWLALRITTDVGRVARAASGLAEGDLTQRAHVSSRDEIGTMATAFNSMAQLLQEMVAEQKQGRREAQERFQLAFHNAPIGMCLVGMEGQFLQVNRALCQMLGYPEEALLALSVAEVTHPDDVAASAAAMARMRAGESASYHTEARYLHADGRVLWGLMSTSLVRGESGEPNYHVMQIQDLTERRQAEQQLVHQALHDPITGLANRVLLMDRVQSELNRLKRRPSLTGLLFLDIDGFKNINDHLGHDFGDKVLRTVASRLTSMLRPTDTVARIGGDEFVVLCLDLRRRPNVVDIAKLMGDIISEPIMIDHAEVVVTASIGIALTESTETTAEDLLRDADNAMHLVKERGKNGYQIFEESHRKHVTTRVGIDAALRLGLREKRFLLHYQPIIDIRSGQAVGVESLIRLDDPERGLLGPGEFIDVAEDTGLIVPIGTWVLEEACRRLAKWKAAGLAPPGMHTAVNLSARQATRPELVDTVLRVLSDSGLPPEELALELTESVLMEADAQTLRRLEQIHEMGVRLGIDDFGTGYSSLTYLKRLPVTFIKVDRSFVSGLTTDASDREIVTAVIRLGQALNLTTIAEGVETADQLEILGELGCDFAQGYLIGRPHPDPPNVARTRVGARKP